jgi:hypothetical protein
VLKASIFGDAMLTMWVLGREADVQSRLVVGVVLISLLAGCARVHEVDLSSGATSLDDINGAAAGKKVSIEFDSGQARSVSGLDVGPSTTCWTEWDASREGEGEGERVCVPTLEIRRIEIQQRLRGALQGAKRGLWIGAVALGVPSFAFSIAKNGGGDGDLLTLAFAATGLGGLAGAGVGAVIGAARGEDVFIIVP